jgi:hypothetical protein
MFQTFNINLNIEFVAENITESMTSKNKTQTQVVGGKEGLLH